MTKRGGETWEGGEGEGIERTDNSDREMRVQGVVGEGTNGELCRKPSAVYQTSQHKLLLGGEARDPEQILVRRYVSCCGTAHPSSSQLFPPGLK